MLFNSLEFLIFFPLVFVLHWVTPSKYRWMVLLLASYYFYMSWDPYLVFLIMTTTLVSYGCAIGIEKVEKKSMKKFILAICLIVCLGILFVFKYFNFLSDSIISMIKMFGLPMKNFSLKLLLPVGISFYTFQTLSYTIDVYRGDIKAERHLGYYALFVSYFPQLVAGPIERPNNLLPQLKEDRHIDTDDLSVGAKYVLAGFFKKIVVADTIAIIVNNVYNNLSEATGPTILLATILFALQILCDFDGYTNIAIGISKMMGIDLMQNFNNPYSATSIKDFWKRWHISLSTWFRDYVYIPLGGNRCKKPRHMFNLFLTFFLSGLWHGANWTFVIWGILHGFYQIIGSITYKLRKKIREKMKIEGTYFAKVMAQICTFILVTFAWIFFRANSISDIGIIFTKIFIDWTLTPRIFEATFADVGFSGIMPIFVLCSVILLKIINKKIDHLEPIRKGNAFLGRSKSISETYIYVLIAMVIVFDWMWLSSQTGYSNAFIYFQF